MASTDTLLLTPESSVYAAFSSLRRCTLKAVEINFRNFIFSSPCFFDMLSPAPCVTGAVVDDAVAVLFKVGAMIGFRVLLTISAFPLPSPLKLL